MEEVKNKKKKTTTAKKTETKKEVKEKIAKKVENKKTTKAKKEEEFDLKAFINEDTPVEATKEFKTVELKAFMEQVGKALEETNEEKPKTEIKDYDESIDKDLWDDDFKPEKKKNKTKLICIILIISLIILVIIGIIFYFFAKPKVTLKGSKEMKITIKSDYNDPGVIAKSLGKDISSKVKVSGKVNTKKKGTYIITYTAKRSFLKTKVKRRVVVTEKGPVIELEGDKNTVICPKAKYEEIGYKAIDSKEKDITKSVKTSVKDDIVSYTVTDNDNVTYATTRKLIREDKTIPEITLNGNEHIYVTLGSGYKDAGALATDNCSGDLTEKIETTGSVDVNTLGDYTMTYTVTDEYGNTAIKERTVTVQKQVVKRSASLGCGQPGVIYLTFDDGPSGSTTPTILNVLKKYNVKATFFVTNNGPEDLVKREYDEGHLVALHTASHNYGKIYASDEAYWNDLNAVNSRVERVTGKKSNIVRFPGGSSNTVSRKYSSGIMSRLANDLESKGYSYFDWNLDSRDAEGKGCSEVRNNVINGLSKSHGNVILMHDIKESTACAIEDIVKYGLDNGYTFKVLDSSIVCHHKTAN